MPVCFTSAFPEEKVIGTEKHNGVNYDEKIELGYIRSIYPENTADNNQWKEKAILKEKIYGELAPGLPCGQV